MIFNSLLYDPAFTLPIIYWIMGKPFKYLDLCSCSLWDVKEQSRGFQDCIHGSQECITGSQSVPEGSKSVPEGPRNVTKDPRIVYLRVPRVYPSVPRRNILYSSYFVSPRNYFKFWVDKEQKWHNHRYICTNYYYQENKICNLYLQEIFIVQQTSARKRSPASLHCR